MGFCKVNAIQRSPLNIRPFKGLLKRERERDAKEEDCLAKSFYRRGQPPKGLL